jgi:hypothetical protein
MQARASKACLDIGFSEGSKEGLLKGCNKDDFCNIEDMVSDQVLVLL